MYRSIIKLDKTNIKDLNVAKADAAMISFNDYCALSSEQLSFLHVIKAGGCDIYFGIDQNNLRASFSYFENQERILFKGIVLENPKGSIIRKTSINLRTIENKFSVVFGYFKILLLVTNIDVARNIENIADYFRVNYIGYHQIVNNDGKFLEKINYFHKIVLTPDKFVKTGEEVLKLNNYYALKPEEVKESERVFDEFMRASKSVKKTHLSKINVNMHFQRLNLAYKLNLTNKHLDEPYFTLGGREKIYKNHAMRYFYPLGDDIGSGVVTGLTSVVFFVFFILLMVFGINNQVLIYRNYNEVKSIFAIFLALEFVLNILLCLYHAFGMHLQAKQIFKKLEEFVFFGSVVNVYITTIFISTGIGATLAVGYFLLAIIFYFIANIFNKKIISFLFAAVLWWLPIVVAVPIMKIYSRPLVVMLTAGSALATVGLFFLNQRKKIFSHFIWHLFLMAAQTLIICATFIGVTM